MSKKVISIVAIIALVAIIGVGLVGCNVDDISVDESHFEVIDMPKDVFVASVVLTSIFSDNKTELSASDIEWVKEIKTLKKDGLYATAVKFADAGKAKEFADAVQARIDKEFAAAEAMGMAVSKNDALSSAVRRKGTLVVYGALGAVNDAIN